MVTFHTCDFISIDIYFKSIHFAVFIFNPWQYTMITLNSIFTKLDDCEPPISVRLCTFQEDEKLNFSSTIKVYVDIPKTWWLENNETIFD